MPERWPTMKFGVALFVTEHGLLPHEAGLLAEEHGFESLFYPEHTHIPTRSQDTFPFHPDRQVPVEYRQLLDPFVALTASAAATSQLKLGTGICLVIQHDPIALAKTVATLDVLSGGRVLFGIGAGWNVPEMANHGTDPGRRFKLMRERVQAMQEIWTNEVASFDGELVQFDDMWASPKPVQKPHPPILIAGNGPHAVDRVISYGDEWLPEPEPSLPDRIQELKERSRSPQRPEGIPVTVYSARLAEIETYEAAGAHRCVFWLPPNDADGARKKLKELARGLGLS